MRESDMRERVRSFMQSRLRNLLAPATLGLGLAISGCSSDGLTDDDGGAPKKDTAAETRDSGTHDNGSPSVKYMAQMPDASPDVGGAAPAYMAPMYMAPDVTQLPSLPSSRS